jgi:hypothetical protein
MKNYSTPFCRIWGFHGGDYEELWRTSLVLQLSAHSGSSLADFSTLKMEAIRSSETSVQSTTTTRRHTPEDGILRTSNWFTDIKISASEIILELPFKYIASVNQQINYFSICSLTFNSHPVRDKVYQWMNNKNPGGSDILARYQNSAVSVYINLFMWDLKVLEFLQNECPTAIDHIDDCYLYVWKGVWRNLVELEVTELYCLDKGSVKEVHYLS